MNHRWHDSVLHAAAYASLTRDDGDAAAVAIRDAFMASAFFTLLSARHMLSYAVPVCAHMMFSFLPPR